MSAPQDLSSKWIPFASFSRDCNKGNGRSNCTIDLTSSKTALPLKGVVSQHPPSLAMDFHLLSWGHAQVLKQEQFSQYTDGFFHLRDLIFSLISDLIWLTPTRASTSDMLGWCKPGGERSDSPSSAGARSLLPYAGNQFLLFNQLRDWETHTAYFTQWISTHCCHKPMW